MEFLKLCGVAKLSESYTQESITEHYMPFPELQAYMHKVMPILQRYLLTNYLDIFNAWKEEWKLHDDLPDWKFAKVWIFFPLTSDAYLQETFIIKVIVLFLKWVKYWIWARMEHCWYNVDVWKGWVIWCLINSLSLHTF